LIPIADAAKARDMNLRHLQTLCKTRRVPGAKLIGRLWMLPDQFTIIPGKRGPKLSR
jgi:hypothetical protein